MAKWRKFRQLPRTSRWLLVESLAAVSLAVIAIALLGLKRSRDLLSRLTPAGELNGDGQDHALLAQTIAAMIKRAAWRGPVRANCLEESLALWWLLRRKGIRSELRIGVNKQQGRFEAHAWAEHRGVALNDGADPRSRFAVFDRAISLDR